jgi:DNA modification methylase
MTAYGRLFTWSVIEKELRRIGTHQPSRLRVASKKMKEWTPSKKGFRPETSTVWRFRNRGEWCVHSSEYRGNWAPQIPRNLIIRFTKPGCWVLDPFMGGGTTAIECLLLARNFVGLDVNPLAIQISRSKVRRMKVLAKKYGESSLPKSRVIIKRHDARNLDFLKDNSIDLVCAHPPYADSLTYTDGLGEDISRIHDIDEYCEAIRKVAAECHRVLRTNRVCAVMIGDIRRDGELIPLERHVSDAFSDVGFRLRERIVKVQYNDRSTAFYLDIGRQKRYWIAHEFLLIFDKKNSGRH